MQWTSIEFRGVITVMSTNNSSRLLTDKLSTQHQALSKFSIHLDRTQHEYGGSRTWKNMKIKALNHLAFVTIQNTEYFAKNGAFCLLMWTGCVINVLLFKNIASLMVLYMYASTQPWNLPCLLSIKYWVLIPLSWILHCLLSTMREFQMIFLSVRWPIPQPHITGFQTRRWIKEKRK